MIKTEIILNGKYLDLLQDVPMPFTYQIADIKNPQKKNTNFSKTITLPGTAINNQIFGWIWDTNVTIISSGTTNFTPFFNPNKKADVRILYDGAEVFKGFMKLDKIKVLRDYKIEYDVTCFGKLKDLFLEIGEKTMADLNLSKYNHPYTKDVQVASWNNYIYSSDYIGGTKPFEKGDGYVYPMVDYALNNNIDWKTEHFFPAVYYKTLIHEIITQAGYKYDGSIFNDNDFKSLVVSYGSGDLKLSNAQVIDRIFQASNTSVQKFDSGFGLIYGTGIYRNTNPTLINFQDDSTPPNADVANNYNTTLSEYTAPNNGLYSFTNALNVSFTHFPTSGTNILRPYNFHLGGFQTRKNGQVINDVPVFIYGIPTSDQMVIQNNQYYVQLQSPITSGSTSITFPINVNSTVLLNAGDIITTTFYRGTGINAGTNIYNDTTSNIGGYVQPTPSYTRINIEIDSIFKNNMASVAIMEGDTVEMSNLFSSQLKQKDFISSFFKLFNIYTETDKYDPYLLHFEPRVNFYQTSGTIRNWDDKLDYSQNYEITPMGDLDERTYLFKFKDDKDYWNDYYKKKYNETYGQRKYEVDNDWLSNTNTNEVIFSPTPLVDRGGDDKVIPRIIQMNAAGQPQPLSSNANKAANLRLWYYGGIKTTNNSYNWITSSGTHTGLTDYAYAGHLDDVANPNYDVNFGIPIEVYYTATDYTNNNLFNKYYRQFIEEISDKDSKIFVGYFHLNPVDIAILNFRDLFYFHGSYWILNKIYDFNPTENGRPTKCEFLKLKAGVPFTPTSGTTNGGTGVTLGDGVFPVYNDSIPKDGNIFDSNVLISGSNNIVASSVNDAIVVGSNNAIGEGVKFASIFNSSGTTIGGGVNRVAIFNTNDFTVDRTYDNSVIINGVRLGGKQIIWSSGTYTFDGTEQNVFAIFEIAVNTSCYLPPPSLIYDGYTLEIKNANNSLYILEVNIVSDTITPVWSPGDGTNATQHKLNQKESFKYTYYDGVWYIY